MYKLISPNYDVCVGCCGVSGLAWGLLIVKLYQNFENKYMFKTHMYYNSSWAHCQLVFVVSHSLVDFCVFPVFAT